MNSLPYISIVCPIFNEAESIIPLIAEIRASLASLNRSYEILYVDDGSTDQSWKVLSKIASESDDLHLIRLRRNFGKATALAAGFAHARGEIVFTLDGDLQDDPRDIGAFIKAIESGIDVACGWRKVRNDRFRKVALSKVFNIVVSKVTGVKLADHNCGYKAYRAEVVKNLDIYGELHRFIPVLAAAKGYKVGQVLVNHRTRTFGRSKYGLWRLISGTVDLVTVKFLTSFRYRPMHFLGMGGILSSLLGFAGLSYLAIIWIVEGMMGFRPLLFYSICALVVGVQFFALGLLAEMIVAYKSSDDKSNAIAELFSPQKSSFSENSTAA